MQDPINEQQNLIARYGVGGIRTDEGYHYFVDNPRSWTLGDFRTKVSGWCVSLEKGKPTGIRALWEGGEAVGRYGEPRPEVTHAFGRKK